MRKWLLAAALIGPSFIGSGTAFAADNGFYLGASVGQANVEIDSFDIGGAREDFDAKDTGYKLIVGIRPLDWLAVEANYVNFGKPDDTVRGMRLQTEGDGISAFAVGLFTAGPVDLFAKGGLIAWDTKISGFNGDDGTDFAWGAGLQFRVWSLAVRAEYEVFDTDVFDDVNMVSVGATYTFL